MFLRLVGLSIVLILALSGLFICMIPLFMGEDVPKPPNDVLVVGAFTSLLVSIGSLSLILRINRKWLADFRLTFDGAEREGTLLARWSVPPEIWQAFVATEGPWNFWQRRQTQAEVWLKGDGIRINDRVVCWTQFGYRLEEIRIQDTNASAYASVLDVTISYPAGEYRATRSHRVPVMDEVREQVHEAIHSIVDHSASARR